MDCAMKMPWIIPEMCVGCGSCEIMCPVGIIYMADKNIRGVTFPWIKEPEKCIGCQQCAKTCMYGALMMTAYRKEAIERLISGY